MHSAIERRVTDRSGDVGARLHAGRSRNDLVVTDLRLWLLAAGRRIDGLGDDARADARRSRARARRDRHAGHDPHARRADRHARTPSARACVGAPPRPRTPRSVGGSRTSTSRARGRGAGHVHARPRPGRRRRTTRVRRAFDNSIDAVSRPRLRAGVPGGRRDLRDALSRLAADLARWTDPAFGWAELDEAYTTGSSMMPQKRNPDTAELVRAKAGRIAAGFVALMSVLQGCRSGTTATSRRTRNRCSTPPTRSSWCSAALVGAVDRAVRPRAMRAAARRKGSTPRTSRRRSSAGRAVSRGAPANGRAAEATRPGRSGSSRPQPRRMAVVRRPDGASLLDPEVSVRSRSARAGRRRRASSSRRTRSGAWLAAR